LQFRLGKTAEAEASVREAEAIDPTASPEYREKLYSLLGQILRKKGDTEGARRCADRVAAIRLGSRASEFEEVNLLPQARQVLERAIALWPDDCALQAQLAHILDSQCLPEEAEKHYRKAFESLPACMGENSDIPYDVERMLRDSGLEPAGMDVLNRLTTERPNDAEAYFARGLINENAGRSKEAVSDFRQAVTLDPRHVGAWSSLASLAWPGLIDPEEAQRIAFKLIDLDADPAGRRQSTVDLVDVKDLPSAYRALRAKLRALPTQENGTLFPLHCPGADPRIHFRDTPAAAGIFPQFDRLTERDRLVGWYFQSSDVGEIARLFHPTDYPFE
jgi:tetratricopeptide (TPR) repeat protein